MAQKKLREVSKPFHMQQIFGRYATYDAGNTSPAIIIAFENSVAFIPVEIFCSSKNESSFSVGILPVSLSSAIGQPPNPFTAESKRRHPAFQAACTFSLHVSGVVCRCAPFVTSGNSGITFVKSWEILSGLETPIVSASAMVFIPLHESSLVQ